MTGPRTPGNPAASAPSATSIRFAVLVFTITASTGSIFGYLWQLSRPDVQARLRGCMSPGPLAGLVAPAARIPGARSFLMAACLRSAGPAVTTWFLAGIALLGITSVALYAITPWWMIRVGRLADRRRLAALDPHQHPELTAYLGGLVAQMGLPCPPAFLVDASPQGRRRAGAQAFGHQRRTYIRLDRGLLRRYDTDRAGFTGVLLHELAHLRNRDNRPTYLTIAAWRAFAVLVPAGYLATLASGARPSVPEPRALLAVLALAALVLLSTRAVLRARELHADATAAASRPGEMLRAVLAAGAAPAPSRWQRAWRYHPDWADRAAVLRDPGLLYRADGLAMFSAGVAIALTISDLEPDVFGAVLSSRLGAGAVLASGSAGHYLILALVTYGPSALFAALAITAITCAATWRLQYRAAAGRAPMPVARLALPMTAGMLAGGFLDFSDAVAGTWGAFDTSVRGDLAVAALSAILLVLALAALSRWASESAAVWFRGGQRFPRTVYAAATLAGALGLAPVLYAWSLTHELALSVQVLWGPDQGDRPFIGRWPAAAPLFAHYAPLGVFDTTPGNAFLLALPCVFVAAGGLLRARGGPVPGGPAPGDGSPRVSLKAVAVSGFLGALVSLAVVLAAMLALRAVIGGQVIHRTAGPGLVYLSRAAEAVIAVCAGGAAVGAARGADRTGFTTGMLAALLSTAVSIMVVPQLLYIGILGWPHATISWELTFVLYGLIGTLGPGRAVIAALVFLAAGGAVTAVARKARRVPGDAGPAAHPPRHDPGPRPGSSAAAASLLAGLLAALAAAAYYYVTLGLS
jgi:Zn-dependent protease with chaperone function